MLHYCVEVFEEDTSAPRFQISLTPPDLFEDTQTPIWGLFDDFSVRFSGTSPTVPTLLNCYALERLLADDEYRNVVARICGPELFAGFITAKATGFAEIDLHDHELAVWQAVWEPLQTLVCEQTGQEPIEAIADFVYEGNIDLILGQTAKISPSQSNNVVSIFR